MSKWRDAVIAHLFPDPGQLQEAEDLQRSRELDSMYRTHQHYQSLLAEGHLDKLPAAERLACDLVAGFIPVLRDVIDRMVADTEAGGHRKMPVILPPLVELPVETTAVITLRIVMSNLSEEKSTSQIAVAITQTLRMEKEFEAWAEEAKADKTFYQFRQRYPNPGARAVSEWLNDIRKKRGRKYVPNWGWGRGNVVAVGTFLIHLLVATFPEVFELVTTASFRRGSTERKQMLVMTESAFRQFLECESQVELMRGTTEPMVFPPHDCSAFDPPANDNHQHVEAAA